jgi:hypothetical protein
VDTRIVGRADINIEFRNLKKLEGADSSEEARAAH